MEDCQGVVECQALRALFHEWKRERSAVVSRPRMERAMDRVQREGSDLGRVGVKSDLVFCVLTISFSGVPLWAIRVRCLILRSLSGARPEFWHPDGRWGGGQDVWLLRRAVRLSLHILFCFCFCGQQPAFPRTSARQEAPDFSLVQYSAACPKRNRLKLVRS